LRIALIYNPLSGSRHERHGPLISAVSAIFESAGHQVTLLPTEQAAHATALAVQVAASHELILSAGGDGTAHEILQALVDTQSRCALGVLPFGTGNVLAGDLALSRDPLAAARTLLTYKPRRISAGKIEFIDASGNNASRYFTVAAGIGAHALLIYAASADAKRRGGIFTYYYTGFVSLFTHPFAPMRVVIRKPGGEIIERTAVEAVAMRVSSFGGLLKNWRPGGALISEELRVILLTRAHRGELFRYSLAAFAGHTSESAGIQFHSATHLTCEALADDSLPRSREVGDASSTRDFLHTQADGEILGTAPITMSIVPDAFTLLMPSI
jgi:diacylglycerol kinase (ATP)